MKEIRFLFALIFCVALAAQLAAADEAKPAEGQQPTPADASPASAAETPAPSGIIVEVMQRKADGQLVRVDVPNSDFVTWFKEYLPRVQMRIAEELADLPTGMVVQLVSIPHPEVESAENLRFLTWRHKSISVPLFGRFMPRQVDLFASLEIRLAAPGQPEKSFPGLAQVTAEYTPGLTTTVFSAVESHGPRLFDEAVGKALAAAKAPVVSKASE